MGRALKEVDVSELQARIVSCEENKARILSHINKLKEKVLSRKISYSQYEEALEKKLDKKTLGEWFDFYNDYIKECKLKIKKQESKKTRKKVLTSFLLVFVLASLFIIGFYLRPAIIGFIIQQPSNEFTQQVNIEFNQTSDYEFTPDYQGLLNSLKISGLIEGTEQSQVKIYLDNLLILDSFKLQQNQEIQQPQQPASRTSPLTGMAIGESVQEAAETNQSPSQEQPLAENTTQETIQGTSQEITVQETNQTIQENNTQSQEAQNISPSQEPPVSENITQPSENINQPTQEPVIPAVPETPTIPEIPPETPTENITPITPEITPEIPANITKKIIEFSDICEQTCNLSGLNLNKSSYSLRIEITNARFMLGKITYSLTSPPEEIPVNITPTNITPTNITNITEINITEENITQGVIQEQIEINKPVKWKTKIKASSLDEAIQKLPKYSSIFSANQVQDEFEIDYQTPAPQALEEQISGTKKRVTLTAPELNYTDVLAYTNIPEIATIQEKDKIKIYWIENSSYIDFTAKDTDNNDLLDYVEWIAPHLSNQTFEIIIEISKAEHLSSNRTFISDIYEQVKSLDNIWSPAISNKEYVRVTFNQNLTSGNDITIYPRTTKGNPKIEVYEKDSNEEIAEFSKLNDNQYNTIFLTNLQGEQDTFDLQIQGGSIEIEHIIDPWANPSATTDLQAQQCTGGGKLWGYGNFSGVCNGTYPSATCGAGADLISCNDSAYETRNSNTSHFAGINITVYNASIADCSAINKVYVCHQMFVSGAYANCALQVSLDGTSAGFTNATMTCPPTSNPAGITCYDVTANVSWACANLFGASAKAGIRFYGKASSSTRTLSVDALFLNVSYNESTKPWFTGSPQYPANITVGIRQGFGVDYNATDNREFDSFIVNETTKFTINSSGWLSNNTALVNGTWYINVTINDTSGNANSSLFKLMVDGDAPLLTQNAPANQTYSSGVVTFNLTANQNLGFCALSLNSFTSNQSITVTGFTANYTNNSMTQGSYRVKFWCNDTYNNVNSTEYKDFAVDINAPNLNITFPLNRTNWSVHALGINYSRNDTVYLESCWYTNTSGQVNYSLSACANISSITFWNNGTHNVTIYANDSGGHINASSITFYIDTGNPNVNITFPINMTNYSTNNLEVNFSRTDGITGLDSCWYTNTSGVVNYSLAACANVTLRTWIEGINNVTVYVNDSAGNTNKSYITFYVDTVAPNITIDTPANQTYNNSRVVSFNLTASEILSSCVLAFDNFLNNQSITVTGVSANYTNNSMSDGEYRVKFWCNDTANNHNDTEFKDFKVDATNPPLTINSPSNTTYVTTNVDFNLTSNETLSFCVLSLDNFLNNQSITVVGVSANYTNSSMKSGEYRVNFWCNDSYDNRNGTEYKDFQVAISNTAPQITYIQNSSLTGVTVTPTTNSYTEIELKLTVYDEDGASNINTTSVKANFTRTNQELRNNDSCQLVAGEDLEKSYNFSCTISMWYFDTNGTWNIGTYAEDLLAEKAQNISTVFDYGSLTAFEIYPSWVLWANVTPLDSDKTSLQNTTLNNTGNSIINPGNISINATNLRGVTDNTKFFDIGNITVSWNNTASKIPPGACQPGNNTANATSTNISIANLTVGNLSLNDGTAQENLYYCILRVPQLVSQIYASNETGKYGAWKITINLVFLFAPKLRKRKKKLKDDKLMKALSLITDELKEEYSLNKKQVTELIIDKLKEKYKLTEKELNELARTETKIPGTIFSKNLGALESLVKYMKENLNLSYHQIAVYLNRDDRTIWTAYNKASKKQKQAIKAKETSIFLPLEIFKNRNLTILENIIIYLKELGLKNKQIAELIERNQRNISTIYYRIRQKIKRKIYK